MTKIKKFFKLRCTRAWFITAAVLIALFLTVTIVATATKDFYELLNTVMPGGGPRARLDSSIDPIYTTTYEDKDEVYEVARAMNREICEEGMVLLKNKTGALPVRTTKSQKDTATVNPKVSVFGKNSVNIAYGGSGSGGANTSNAVNLYDGLKEAGFDINPTLEKFYKSSASGDERKGNSKDLDSGDTVVLSTAETPQSLYTDAVRGSYKDYNDAAFIVITRIGGEGFDIPRQMVGAKGYRNETDHFLQLDKNEEDLIAAVCEAGFEKVVLLVNTGNAMELGFLESDTGYVTAKGYNINPDKIDAAIWMGFPGETGTLALGEILNGNVNPSGRLADTYDVDHTKDPTWFNFGDNRETAKGEYGKDNHVTGGDEYYFNVDRKLLSETPYYFADYEEGVYVGYKYYETRGVTDGEEWYKKNVVYPFGYGLSYSKFDWQVEDKTAIDGKTIAKGQKYTVKIKVTNSGTEEGKDVVELYGHAPYLGAGKIEKPQVTLVDFAKTKSLKPGESDIVTLEFDPYLLASYDYKDQNSNGYKTFELDKSDDYALYVSASAHDKKFEIPFKVGADIVYDKDPVTNKTVENRYTDCENEYFDSDYKLDGVLSRSDFDGTFPKTKTKEEREGTLEFLEALQDLNHNNPTDFDDYEYPWFEEDNGLVLRDLLYDEDGEPVLNYNGKFPNADYKDERWELLLDECSIAELVTVYNYGSYHIEPIDRIKLPRINCADGPVGWACFMDTARFYDTCSYCAETLVATSWSKETARKFGETVGDEGIIGNYDGDRLAYSGWYAPGVNIHRSPFGGRNFEYYSEDGVLSGKIGAQQVLGCRSRGVVTLVKHFAINEQETHRSISGDCSWLTEQSMREIYLRPFEIIVKEGETLGIMSSFNRIGTRWTGGDYRLLTEILRDEWGFKGSVLCDFNTIPQYMNSRQMAYAGGDINLATQPVSWVDEGSTEDLVVLRQCIKNVLYSYVNSNAMNAEVVGYKLPLWVVWLIVIDVLLVVGMGVWGFFAIRKMLRSPDAEPKRKKAETSESVDTEATEAEANVDSTTDEQ